jgi:hypothetical protein
MMDDAQSDDVTGQLLHVLSRVHAHHEERLRDAELGGALAYLGMWQVRRLRNTYADLQQIPRYAAAMQFFESDLYGGGDFAQRDADLARVVPGMKRLLPDHALRTVADAVEVTALALDFDRAMIEHLPRREPGFTVAEYCAAYRAVDRFEERRRQILLVSRVGVALDGLVRKPMLGSALKLMRKPARLAGLAALQDFLERGFRAFANMRGAREFAALIEARELAILQSIGAGSDAPFPDPMVPSADAAREVGAG